MLGHFRSVCVNRISMMNMMKSALMMLRRGKLGGIFGTMNHK